MDAIPSQSAANRSVIPGCDDATVPAYESRRTVGERRSQQLRTRAADELHHARVGAGTSLRALSRLTGMPRGLLARAERGDAHALTIDLLARVAPFLGRQAVVALPPSGTSVRDAGHVALLGRLRERLPGLALDFEVPVPITGDSRSGDAIARLPDGEVLFEAETRLHDVQELERRIFAKARDLGVERVVLVVADTRHNHHVIDNVGSLRERFPGSARATLASLAAGRLPERDALVIL